MKKVGLIRWPKAYLNWFEQDPQADCPDRPRAEEDGLQGRADDHPGQQGAHLHQQDRHAGKLGLTLNSLSHSCMMLRQFVNWQLAKSQLVKAPKYVILPKSQLV